MVRSIVSVSVGITLTIAAAGAAYAQAAGSGTPVPGTGDSTKISGSNRDNNAAYNHLISAGEDKASTDKDDRRPAAHSAAVAATAADFKVGSPLRDVGGVHIGTVSEVDPDGVVVDTGTTKIKVPATAFGKDSQGLLLAITAAKFNELIAQVHASH
jgi:hypothetical protein